MKVSETATLSTAIDTRVKDALVSFCKWHGIKLWYIIEQALIEQFEDEFDLEAYEAQKNEEIVSLEEVLAGQGRKR